MILIYQHQMPNKITGKISDKHQVKRFRVQQFIYRKLKTGAIADKNGITELIICQG